MPLASRILAAAAVAIIGTSFAMAHFPEDWWLENIAVAVGVVAVASTHRRYPLSVGSHALLVGLLCVHEYGATHSYLYTPIGEAMKPWFGSERNHYDRVVHFVSGLFLILPLSEIYVRVTRHRGWAIWFAVQSVMFLGGMYEVAEWAAAQATDPQLGEEFVGIQGDTWDATKDLGWALLGAAIAAAVQAGASIRSTARPGESPPTLHQA